MDPLGLIAFKEIAMNTYHRVSRISVKRLSVLLDEKAVRERKVIRKKAIDRIMEKSTPILAIRDQKMNSLKNQLVEGKKRIAEIGYRIAKAKKELKEQSILQIACPGAMERRLYAKNAEDIRQTIEGLNRELEEIRGTLSAAEEQEEKIRSEADDRLKAIEMDPLVALWRTVTAEVRCGILRILDDGRYEEARQAAQMEGNPELAYEVQRQINAKKVAASAARRVLYNPIELDLPKGARMLGHLSDVVIAIDKRRKECARWGVSPLGCVMPVPKSRRIWRKNGNVVFRPIADLMKNGGMKKAMEAAAKAGIK
jgi:hypothetical protein